MFRKCGAQAVLLACLSMGTAINWSATSSYAQNPGQAGKERSTNVVFVPPGRGKPSASVGGASRSQTTCVDAAEQGQLPTLTPLTPLVDSSDIVLTANSRPEFMVHVGETGVRKIFYALRDESGRHLYQDVVSLPGEIGIARVEIPAGAPELEAGEFYLVSFVAVCGSYIKPDSPRADVWIERVSANELGLAANGALDRPDSLEKAALLGSQGIWLDMVEVLANVRESFSEETTWRQVMEAVGLEELAADPFLPASTSLPR